MISSAPDHVPYFYRALYELLKKVLRLDKRYIKKFPEFAQEHMNKMLVLASGIHLARKEGDFSGNRKYFESALKALID